MRPPADFNYYDILCCYHSLHLMRVAGYGNWGSKNKLLLFYKQYYYIPQHTDVCLDCISYIHIYICICIMYKNTWTPFVLSLVLFLQKLLILFVCLQVFATFLGFTVSCSPQHLRIVWRRGGRWCFYFDIKNICVFLCQSVLSLKSIFSRCCILPLTAFYFGYIIDVNI